ncbi:MAG: HIT domain-containing protein [Chloroflexia bacterium]|nr:HIT domain-containing protein [Chloroflexia bacterium]
MEIKWTPWRMAYIQGEKEEGCVLCRIGAESKDRENMVLCRGERCYVVLNLYPYNTGHIMVAPYAHLADLTDLDVSTSGELIILAQRSLRVLRQEFHPQGFNLGMNLGQVAGAGIADHVHLHVLPRWQGDANFMPLIAGTKLIPELLEETYARLRRAFDLGD